MDFKVSSRMIIKSDVWDLFVQFRLLKFSSFEIIRVQIQDRIIRNGTIIFFTLKFEERIKILYELFNFISKEIKDIKIYTLK